MARERVVFPFNEVITVTLDSPGVLQASTDPSAAPEWRYFLQGGKVMWVPPVIHDAITAAANGNPTGMSLDLQRYKDGQKPFVWQVRQGRPAAQAAPAIPPPVSQPPNWANQPAAPARQPAANGHAAQAAQFQQPSHSEEIEPGPADRLAAAWCSSIDLAIEAREYATRKGMQISFSAADLRAMAATLFLAEGRQA